MGPNSTYCITVLAFNEAGDGPAAKCINFTTRDGACPISWMRYQDSCYLNVSKPANWPRAKQECISRHSQLVTIYNEDEFMSVAALAENFSWIGAEWNENKSKHVWLDGSDIEFHPPMDG
ncbi:C-type lectin domain family 12 member B-like, partial [Pocillopora damicornis]|uniref:C-type lectin domain family 12 member B-like n=1 Tax=Pocillopora damicornis TaxID=46731 RepID=UPI000F54F233